MEYRENRILYDGSSYSRLWEKSAIGILADGPGLLLTDSEVIFCREHRGVEFNGLNDHGSYSSWLTDRIEVNQNLLLETAILEALRVPGNKVVLSENFDSLNLGKSRSWAMRWSSDGHPKKGAPVSEILWFESKDLLNGKVESGESMLKDLLYWCVEVEEMGRIPEVLIIDEEQSVVTYRLSECNPTGVMEKPAKEIIDEISETNNTQSIEIILSNDGCPILIPDGFSPNGDGLNDFFNIQGLYDVFVNHKLLIYNRNGALIFRGDNNTKWDGTSNNGLGSKSVLLPVGTYFYVLYLIQSQMVDKQEQKNH